MKIYPTRMITLKKSQKYLMIRVLYERKENKIKSVVSKLENISVEDLAKILIEARKTKLIEV